MQGSSIEQKIGFQWLQQQKLKIGATVNSQAAIQASVSLAKSV